MKNIIKEFLEYRKLVKNINSSTSLTRLLKLKLMEQKREVEEEIGEVLLGELIKLHLNGELSYDYIRGFRECIAIRKGLIRQYNVVATTPLDK